MVESLVLFCFVWGTTPDPLVRNNNGKQDNVSELSRQFWILSFPKTWNSPFLWTSFKRETHKSVSAPLRKCFRDFMNAFGDTSSFLGSERRRCDGRNGAEGTASTTTLHLKKRPLVWKEQNPLLDTNPQLYRQEHTLKLISYINGKFTASEEKGLRILPASYTGRNWRDWSFANEEGPWGNSAALKGSGVRAGLHYGRARS